MHNEDNLIRNIACCADAQHDTEDAEFRAINSCCAEDVAPTQKAVALETLLVVCLVFKYYSDICIIPTTNLSIYINLSRLNNYMLSASLVQEI